MSQIKRSKEKQTFNHLVSRMSAAIVMVLLISVIMIPGMSTYLPVNQNDAIGIPILMFPFIWAGLFIYCFMDRSIWRIWLVLISLVLVHAACVYLALAG